MKKPNNTLALDAYKRLLAQQEEAERKARREKKAKPSHEESTTQRACVAWFRAEYPEHEKMLFAVPNGGGRSRVEAAIMKGEGVTAGVSDFIFLEARGGYGALCIEMKRLSKDSRQSKAQRAWQEAAEKAGNMYVVCRTLAEFQTAVRRYMSFQKHVIKTLEKNGNRIYVYMITTRPFDDISFQKLTEL